MTTALSLALIGALLPAGAAAQGPPDFVMRANNRPLPSLAAAGARARANPPGRRDQPREIPNFRGDTRASSPDFTGTDSALQANVAAAAASAMGAAFDGASNEDNANILGFVLAPPDTDGDVGPDHYVQMVNLLTTVFDKAGNALDGGPFPSNAIWDGAGGLCEEFNQGDPIVLYDNVAGRWFISQFAFDDNFTVFSQCIAVSQGGDPLRGYNRYEFDFTNLGLPDYPKHGIVTNSITLMTNIFAPPLFTFGGTYLAVIDKNAAYNGNPTTIVGTNIGNREFGFVAGDLDGTGSAPALFAALGSRRRQTVMNVWQYDVDWMNPSAAQASRIAQVPVAPFDADFCSASREACIPQPSPGVPLETLSDRLMHRLQIRDFGSHRTLMTSHSVDAGGRGGVRWYELRESGGNWSLHQQGTFAPDDGLNRWMPSVAMNGAGAIGVGYMVSSSTQKVSVAVAGQTAAQSGSGVLDVGETFCQIGTGVQTDNNRAGDYSATSVDEASGNFWHTNEYMSVFTTGIHLPKRPWATTICEFTVGGGVPPGDPTEIHVASIVTGTAGAGKGLKRGTASVVIQNDLGGAFQGATVEGAFSGTFNQLVSGTTESDGSVTFQTDGTAKGGVTVNFCVNAVGGALLYDPTDNGSPSYACPQ